MSKSGPGGQTVRLGDIVERVTRKNSGLVQAPLTISARFGLINQREFFNKQVASKDLSNYILLERGDFAYNKSYSAGYPLGVIKRLERYSAGVVSPLYLCFRIAESDVDSDFLAHYFESGIFNAELASIAKEGARNHGLLNVSPSHFFDLKIQLPPLSEQKKVAAILSSADKAIEISEAVIERLEMLKQAIMQEFFSGKLVALKTARISDLVKRVIDNRGKTPPVASRGYELLEVAAIVKNKKSPDYGKVTKFVDDVTYKSWFRNGHPEVGDIIVPTVGSIGTYSILKERRGAIAQNLVALQINDNYLSDYVYYALSSSKVVSGISSILMGAVQPSLRVPQFLDLEIDYPESLQWQERMANSLSSIDQSIESKSRVVERLKILKQAQMQDLLTGAVRARV